MISADDIRTRIAETMPDAEVDIKDLTGGGDHYQVSIISKAFEGKNAVARHRMVYAALKEPLGGDLHALALQTRTPDET